MTPSSTIAHYRIVSKLGEGGMGAVYRATDTKLGRDVAIKVLPPAFAEDAGRMQRFEREAQVLASLNHPNIAAIYGIEKNAIVMELVEGADLAGPLPVETALAYARQIAAGLEAAHERGIIHRDLKPANIKVTPEGTVKLLDFGLAKAGEPSAPSTAASPTVSPTLSLGMTQAGMILGTAAYMAPEQARGKPVDKRADIWAFGVVLFEMLTGRHLYGGRETVTDTLAAVVLTEPDYSALPPDTPPRIRKLIERCLRKDPKQRLRDIGDARLVLDETEAPAPAASPARARRSWLPWAVAILFAIVAGAAAWRATRPVAPAPFMRLGLPLPPDTSVDIYDSAPIAISNDGSRVAVALRGPDNKTRIYTKLLQDAKLMPLAGTESGSGPFFSPDGRWIGFIDQGSLRLKKITVEGGPALAICEAPSARGAGWQEDGNIVVALYSAAALMRVSSAGGTPQPLTAMRPDERTQRWPQVLPEDRAVIFTSHSSNTDYDNANIDVVVSKTGERRTLVRGGFAAQYIPSGHLVYIHQSTLFAAPFDIRTLTVTGPATPVADRIVNAGTTGGVFAVSRSGFAIYLEGSSPSLHGVFSVDESGKKEPIYNNSSPVREVSAAARTSPVLAPRLSPDGRRLAFSPTTPGGGDLWVKDLDRDQATRLTFLPGFSSFPVWTPDGKTILFLHASSLTEGTLHWIRSDGAGGPQVLSDSIHNTTPFSISPDGRTLAMQQSVPNQGEDIVTVPIEGEPGHPRLGKPTPFVATSAQETQPAFSPDGRWIAYASTESGTVEVYVRPFPGPGGRWQISTGGGLSPRWSRTGHELVYETQGRDIIRVEYTATGDSFAAGKARPWPAVQVADLGTNSSFDISPDGKHLIAILPVSPAGAEKPVAELTFLANFFDELRRRVK